MKDLPVFNNDIKHKGMEKEEAEIMLSGPPSRKTRTVAGGFLSLAVLYLVLQFLSNTFLGAIGRGGSQHNVQDVLMPTNRVVPLEAHIMSKCPDAQDCLKMMVLPAMQRVYEKVNFTLSFIGAPTDNDGVACMHGPEECMGNILELCAASLYPDPKIYLGFTMCLTRDYKDIPQRSLVEDCALEHGMDFDKLNACTVQDDGGFGMGMLRDSVRRSTEVCEVCLYCFNYRIANIWVS
ncbi:gamma interferon inducible lysosomal thiol reductase protein [Rutstroemia sp. NJR-2017a WRK4]|nr:gamma interferon inducible lysosomal thiol reductase protein [Rutstroemia sp. NJR-2017a WRK4]